MTTHDPIPARLAALKSAPTPELKSLWRDLFDSEPPPFNRRYLESRLAYRIQELAYGGLKPETVRRLERLGEELDGGDKRKRGLRVDRDRPITGTRLLREWQGVEHVVTVTADGFEWQGRPYKSLSAIARAITGTRLDHLAADQRLQGVSRAIGEKRSFDQVSASRSVGITTMIGAGS